MKRVLFLLLIVLLLGACGAAQAPSDSAANEAPGGEVVEVVEEEVVEEAPAEEYEYGESDSSGAAGAGENAAQVVLNRKIVYTAYVDILVEDPRAAAQHLQSLASRAGGYVSAANLYEVHDDVYEAEVQLRVDATRFDEVLAQVRDMAEEVLDEQLDTQDVTDRYVDLEARIENLERTETELQALLTEARASGGKTEDVLAVYRELTAIREQIEVYQGQLNVLRDSVQLATINVTLVPPPAAVEIVQSNWSVTETVRSALQTLTSGLQVLVDAAIYLTIGIAPILLILGFLFFLGIRSLLWFNKRVQRSTSVVPDAE